jgi:hypothetical protein
MAIWQFRLDLIPTSALRAKYGVVPVSIPQELAEDFPWWSDVQPATGFEAGVDAILPKGNSWSEEMHIWGDERGDTASVCYDNNRKVEWIGFRVDVRELSPGFVRDICRLAAELECVLLTGAYHLIAPDEQTVLAAINRSTAKHYLEDPVATLRSLKPSKGEIVRLPEKAEENGVPPNGE